MDLDLLEKSIRDELTLEELEELQIWLDASPKHREFYEKKRLNQKYFLTKSELYAYREEFKSKLKSGNKLLLRIISSAAVVIIAVFSYYFIFNPSEDINHSFNNQRGVFLTNSMGETVDILKSENTDKLSLEGVNVNRDDLSIAYQAVELTGNKESINSLYVSRGNEFHVELSDGSKVWINSDTKLVYPSLFLGNERRVVIEGEAYFEIARDSLRPFFVSIGGADIKVLGTTFNINNRNPENQLATLVKGSIAIVKGEEYILKQGETSVSNINSEEITINTDDIRKYISWKDGEYYFEESSLADMLHELSLWYDLEIEYVDEYIKQEVFTGWLKRYDSIDAVLKMIEGTSFVQFDVNDNKIVVKSNR